MNEIHVFQAGATNIFAVVRNAAGQVWYPTGEVFEAWGTGGRTAADYDIALTDKSGGMFVGDWDTNIATGTYFIVGHQQAGASPADTDPAIYRDYGYWDGTTWTSNILKSFIDSIQADTTAILADTDEIQGKLPDEYIMGSSTTESMDDEINDILAEQGKVVYGSVATRSGAKQVVISGSVTGFVEDEKDL